MPGDYLISIVNNNRIDKTMTSDARGNLLDLLFRMRTCVPFIGL
jgi:hypothetical protein